jgi:DNA-binding NarL/FixJ family response regulator
MDNQKTDDQKLLNKQDELNREINELIGTVNFLRSWLEQDYKKIKAEMQALSSIKQDRNNAKNKQTLLLNDRYKEVFDLYEKGLSADEIAKKLGKGSGEIEFILQLASQDRS